VGYDFYVYDHIPFLLPHAQECSIVINDAAFKTMAYTIINAQTFIDSVKKDSYGF
jgi:hypothetical protein